MFSILSLVITVFIYFLSFRNIKRKKFISWEIKRGLNCYSCKEKMLPFEDMPIERLKENKDFFILCKSCSREESIDLVTGKKFIKVKNNLKKFLISKRADKIIYYYMVLIGLIFLLDILTGVKIFSVFTSLLNILYAYFFYYRSMLICGETKHQAIT